MVYILFNSVPQQTLEKGKGAELLIFSFSFQTHNQIKSYHLPGEMKD